MKRRQREDPQAGEPGEEAQPEQPKKRRRSLRLAVASLEAGQDAAGGAHAGDGGTTTLAAAAAAAAAAAGGQAPEREEEQAAAQAEAEDDGAAEASEGGEVAPATDGEQEERKWKGVVRTHKVGRCWRTRVWADPSVIQPPGPGGLLAPAAGYKTHVDVGLHATPEVAGRVYDQAAIAIYGLKAARLNYPVEDYAEGHPQRFGADLAAYLIMLSASSRHLPRLPKAKKEKKQPTGEKAEERRRNLAAGKAKANAQKQQKSAATAAVEAARHADPLWAPPREPCGVCPACRQPWRTDLGGCLRLAAAKAAGHDEAAVVEQLANDPAAFKAAYGSQKRKQQEQQQGSPEPQAGAAAGGASPPPHQQQEQQASRRRRRGEEPSQGPAQQELVWLEPPPKLGREAAAAKQAALRELQKSAAVAMRQQLAIEEAAFAAALEREQLPGEPAPARQHAGAAAGGGAGRGRAAGKAAEEDEEAEAEQQGETDAEAAESGQQQGQQQQQQGQQQGPPAAAAAAEGWAAVAAEDPANWLARARPPHDTIQEQGQDLLPALVHLAALCREGGVEVPLEPQRAQQVLEAAEQQQERAQRRLRRARRQQRGGSGTPGGGASGASESELAGQTVDEGEDDGEASEAGGGGGGSEEAEGIRCLLCGGKAHGKFAERCPVMQYAYAVPKPKPVCPGCAHKEIPGCRLCQGTGLADAAAAEHEEQQQQRRHGRRKLFKQQEYRQAPWKRRAPWAEQLAPATRDLMLAVQGAASAAATDLDQPQLGWKLTPKALLAVGLLAEEAARLELAARQPPQPAAAVREAAAG